MSTANKRAADKELKDWGLSIRQFKMRLHLSCYIVLGVFFLAQLNHAGSKTLQEGELLALQLKVEGLVEKIINFIQDIYEDMKGELKCIPDRVSEALMETLKDVIRCVEENERDYNTGKIRNNTRAKNFLRCVTNGRREIRDIMESVDATVDYCPDNVTEKTYQINVTTAFSQTFRINIKNGLEITMEIDLNKDTALNDEEDSTEESDKAQIEGSSKVDNDKHRDTATGGNEGHHGMKETGQGKGLGKPRSSMDKNLTDDNNESNSESSFDYNDDENSTKKTKVGYHQWKHPEEEKRKQPNNNNFDRSDYTGEYDPELRTSSTDDSWDVSSDEMVQHLHRRFFREQNRYDEDFMPRKSPVRSDTLAGV